jgi:hypothetical protein
VLQNTNDILLGAQSPQTLIAEIPPGQVTRWILPATAPEDPGMYQTEWRMFYDDEPFGPAMSALVVVLPNIEHGEIDIDPIRLDPLELLKEWFTGLIDQYLDKIRAFMEDLQRRLIEWLELEAERLLEELVSYLSELCCAAPLVAPTAVLLGALGLRKRRKHR